MGTFHKNKFVSGKAPIRKHVINIKTQIYNIVCMVFFAITVIMYAPSQKIGEPDQLKVFGRKKAKGSEQDTQNA